MVALSGDKAGGVRLGSGTRAPVTAGGDSPATHTEGRFTKTEIIFLGNQPIYPNPKLIIKPKKNSKHFNQTKTLLQF